MVPRSHQSEIMNNSFVVGAHQFNKTTHDITKLTLFLHEWALPATINLINILPRVSRVCNVLINELNKFLSHLGDQYQYINKVNTELNRSLYSKGNVYRKGIYFNIKGTDNVHLNNLGVERLGKHLKHLSHN